MYMNHDPCSYEYDISDFVIAQVSGKAEDKYSKDIITLGYDLLIFQSLDTVTQINAFAQCKVAK